MMHPFLSAPLSSFFCAIGKLRWLASVCLNVSTVDTKDEWSHIFCCYYLLLF